MDELTPIVLFLVIGGTFTLAFYFKYKTLHDIQLTVQTAIARGDPLSPAIIESLATSVSSPYADLRRGIISLALGGAVFLAAIFIDQPEAMGPLTAVSMFPMLVGLAYLGLWYFIGRRNLPGRRGNTVA
jgi:hypothetical protein